MRFRFVLVCSSFALLMVTAACQSEERHNRDVSLEEFREEIGIDLHKISRTDQKPRGESYELRFQFWDEALAESECYVVNAQATLNGVAMKQTSKGGQSENASVQGAPESRVCLPYTFEIPQDAVKNKDSLTLEVWDDTHRIRARYEPVAPPSVEWYWPEDGGPVCAGAVMQARLVAAAELHYDYWHGPEDFQIRYRYTNSSGSREGTATHESRAEDIITFTVKEPAPSEGELEIELMGWTDNSGTVLCDGVTDCGFGPYPRDFTVQLPVTVVDCPRPSELAL